MQFSLSMTGYQFFDMMCLLLTYVLLSVVEYAYQEHPHPQPLVFFSRGLSSPAFVIKIESNLVLISSYTFFTISWCSSDRALVERPADSAVPLPINADTSIDSETLPLYFSVARLAQHFEQPSTVMVG
jgi:hypothetical protein